MPRGLFPLSFAFASRFGKLGLVVGLLLLEPFFGALFDLGFSPGDSLEAIFAAGDLVGQVHAVRYLLVVRRFGQLHELLYFAFQLFFQLIDVPVTHGAVFGCVGFDLAAVQRDVAEVEHAQGAGDQQDLHHQPFDLFQEPFAEGVQRVVVGVLVCGHKAEGDRIVGGVFQLAAGEHARGVAVNQNGQQQCRVIRIAPAGAVGAFHGLQVQLIDNLNNKSRQVMLR